MIVLMTQDFGAWKMIVCDKIIEEGKSAAYAAPRLTVYGDMRALTASSSNKTNAETNGSAVNNNTNNPRRI
jgi:hypothetical protein